LGGTHCSHWGHPVWDKESVGMLMRDLIQADQ